jgi:hypothetical protein
LKTFFGFIASKAGPGKVSAVVEREWGIERRAFAGGHAKMSVQMGEVQAIRVAK